MGKYKISIIIPVYNVEKYIIECLGSIDFTKKDWQIILVDDGSTDNSYELIQDYAKYENVKIISQENAGLSEARNTGIENSDGDYVMFLDSDDMLGEGFQTTLEGTIKFDGTIYFGSSVLKYGDRIVYDELIFNKLKTNKMNSFAIRKFFQRNKISFVAWRYILPTTIAKNIKFEKGLYHEDELFTTELLSLDLKFQFIPNLYYVYRKGVSGSIMSTVTIKHFESVFRILQIIKEMDKNTIVKYEIGKLTLRLMHLYSKLWEKIQKTNELENIIKKNKRYILTGNFKRFLIKVSLYILGVKRTLKILRNHAKN